MRASRAAQRLLRPACLGALLVVAAGGAPGLAQVQRSGGNANAQLMSQYQQVVGERTQLQADNAHLKQEAEELKKQLAAAQQQASLAKAGAERSQAQVAAAHNASQESQKSLDDLRGKMQELVARFRETITTLHNTETERTQLQQQLSESHGAFDRCVEHNYGLYEVNREVLDRYEHQGAFSYMARAEPFTRLKRTQIENLVDEYRARALELREQKPGPGAAPVPQAAVPQRTP
jgi:cell division septum initiation protein DivIVA